MCLDVVETVQSVDVFDEVRRAERRTVRHVLRAHMHMLGKSTQAAFPEPRRSVSRYMKL
jgi:hypothetical protein